MSSGRGGRQSENNHRSQLPVTCIPFSSTEGRKILQRSLRFPHMECYFTLMPQLTTQLNPDCSALACFEMVLNALNVDPGVEWRYPWRWYRQSMLENELSSEPRTELTLAQFLFLASLKPLKIVSRGADNDDLSVDEFRHIIKKCTERDDVFVVIRYSTTAFGLEGGSHFSCVGGYNQEMDLILLLDTARFKCPPYWVSLELPYKAMSRHADEPGSSGGLVLMSRCMESQALMFHLAPGLCPLSPEGMQPDLLKALKAWTKFLDQRSMTELSTTDVCFQAIGALVDSLTEAESVTVMKASRLDRCHLEELYPGVDCVTCTLKENLENTTMFSYVTDALKSLGNVKYSRLENAFSYPRKHVVHHSRISETECFDFCPCDDIRCYHFLTFLLLAWPYEPPSLDSSCFHNHCRKVSEVVLLNIEENEYLTREVAIVCRQLKQLLGLL